MTAVQRPADGESHIGMPSTEPTDRYPTRLDHAIEPIPRQEPVVWGGAADGPLSQHHLDGFSEYGYLVAPETVSEDWLPLLRHELDLP